MMRPTRLKRGQIWYHVKDKTKSRPCIIVSNNMCNKYSGTATIVPLTSQQKKDLPTHVKIKTLQRGSTALCEAVQTVSIEELTDCMGFVTSEELRELEKALAVQLGLVCITDPANGPDFTAGLPESKSVMIYRPGWPGFGSVKSIIKRG